MPEHLRAFVVIAVLSVLTFVVLRRPVVAMGMADEDFRGAAAISGWQSRRPPFSLAASGSSSW